MFNWEDLKNLLVVKQVRQIIYKWWNIDILILDTQIIENNSFALVQDLDFKNPLIKDLFQNKLFCESFFKQLQFYQNKPVSNAFSLLEKWPETGLHILLIPIEIYQQRTGFVIATGFLTDPKPTATDQSDSPQLIAAKEKWLAHGFTNEWYETHKQNIPFIHGTDKQYFIDLTELITKEILSVQQEITEKSQIKNIQKTNNTLWYSNIIGNSKIMRQLYNLLEQIKHSNNTILVQGENGTGKELIAKSIHDNSVRKNQPFIVQNCSALNDNLLESELFGHVKGAFTGAYKDKPGLFEIAHKGTFFLDEVGDTSPAMQVKLLRVIQDGSFFAVGGVEPKKVDVRIIAATNRNLKQMIEQGKFREDLYYRLNVINIQVPALRERKEDISLLAEFFINQLSSQTKIFTKKAMDKLIQYPWPGNVRELQNEAERLAIFSSKNTYIKEEFLSEKIRNKDENKQLVESLNYPSGKIMKKAIANLESRLIARYLREEGWNKTRVAKKLGISRAALVSKVKDYKLERRLIKKAPLVQKKA